MRKNNEMNSAFLKLGLVIGACFCPGLGLVEPATDLIANVLKSFGDPLNKIINELEEQLKGSVRESLDLLKEKTSSDTEKKMIQYLEPYLKLRINDMSIQKFTLEKMNNMFSQIAASGDLQKELYLINRDVMQLSKDFNAIFKLVIVKYPQLADFYMGNRLDELEVRMQKVEETSSSKLRLNASIISQKENLKSIMDENSDSAMLARRVAELEETISKMPKIHVGNTAPKNTSDLWISG